MEGLTQYANWKMNLIYANMIYENYLHVNVNFLYYCWYISLQNINFIKKLLIY